MLIPITQEKFEQLIPLVASAEQYQYYWGKTEDFLRRALISFILVVLFIYWASCCEKPIPCGS